MNLAIGQTILQMRKKYNITQEQLANNIGVSAQAVSKWETDVSYPDISLLPIIAKFFEVTVDYLLGYSLTGSNRNIDEALIQIKQLNFDGEYKKALNLIEEVQTYPINYEIELQRGHAKTRLSQNQEDEKGEVIFLCEAKNIFEMIIQNCNNCKFVNEAKRSLAIVFTRLKEYDKAVDIVSSIDAHFDTTSVMSHAYILKGDYVSGIRLLQENLFRSLDGIYKSCFCLCITHNKMKEFDKAMKYIELSDALYEAANRKGETNFWNRDIVENFYFKEDTLIKAGKMEEAIKVLNQHIDYVISLHKETYDQENDVWYLNQLKPSELKLKESISECERLLNSLKHDNRYNKFRCSPAFNDLIVKLEKEIQLGDFK